MTTTLTPPKIIRSAKVADTGARYETQIIIRNEAEISIFQFTDDLFTASVRVKLHTSNGGSHDQ